MINTKFSETDKLIFDIRNELDYQRFLTPLNFAQENNKFIECYKSHKIYNPQYEYNRFNPEVALRKYELLKNVFSPDGTELSKLYSRVIEKLLVEIKMYQSVGTEEFTAYSNKINGIPNSIYERKAIDILNNKCESAEETFYGADELAEILKMRIRQYGFIWNVSVTDRMAARVSVEPEKKTVYINKNKRFTKNDAIRLQVHEIDTHLLRTENGLLRNSMILSYGTAGSLIHEEGLAIYNEYKNGVSDSFSDKLYAARFLTSLNIDKSFYELFDTLMQYGCSEFLSMYVVSRFKRGIRDSSSAGGFIKDYVYFQGLQEIIEAVECDNTVYKKLYYGSVSVQDTVVLDNEINNAIESGTVIFPLKKIIGR